MTALVRNLAEARLEIARLEGECAQLAKQITDAVDVGALAYAAQFARAERAEAEVAGLRYLRDERPSIGDLHITANQARNRAANWEAQYVEACDVIDDLTRERNANGYVALGLQARIARVERLIRDVEAVRGPGTGPLIRLARRFRTAIESEI